jgi:hypothetical protein
VEGESVNFSPQGMSQISHLIDGMKCLISFENILFFFEVILQTPLHFAAYCNHKNCVEKLLQNGADKSLKNV